jgi:hypothetical protein
MLPNASISKVSGGTAGAVPPSAVGVNAIVAAASSGTINQPGAYQTLSGMTTAFQASGAGPLAEYGAYNVNTSQKPVVLERCAATVVGTYLDFTTSVTGSSAVTTSGSSTPLDEYAFVQVKVTTGGTVGTPGIVYTTSCDGGTSTSGPLQLGTATSISVSTPGNLATGVGFNLGGGTLGTGDSWTCYTTRPQPSNSDLLTALTALGQSAQPFENVLIDCDATSTTVNTVDTWLAGLELQGKFCGAFLNFRHKLEPVPTAESEATYAASAATQFNSVSASASLAIAVGADAGDLPSAITGVVQPRPVSLALAARCALVPPGEDPAYVARGPVPGFGIADGNGNPKWHNESLFPDLDNLRLSTFTTQPGSFGVYLTNGNVLSPSGSAFVYVQHSRCMNIACTTAFAKMVQYLGKGVSKKAPDPITGAIYIAEQDAAAIEQDITAAMRQVLKGQVVDVVFQLSRTDDLSPNSGAVIHGQVEIEAFAYIKQFVAQAAFVKSITVPT